VPLRLNGIVMTKTSKDFTPIQEEYAFFETQSTEAESDLDAYAARLRTFGTRRDRIRLLDFGCGPGTFTARFLEQLGWRGGQLDLALVEPSSAYREQAVERLFTLTGQPIRAWSDLPAGVVREFDVVLSNHVFYYVTDLPETLGRILEALRFDGLFMTAIAGWHNSLIRLWIQGFARIGLPIPYHTAEDVEALLTHLGHAPERRTVNYRLSFPDSEENRLKILRFLFGEHLATLPRAEALADFDEYSVDGRIEMRTESMQFYVAGGSSGRAASDRAAASQDSSPSA
jgi:trans-aconitate 2-methyltransferase